MQEQDGTTAGKTELPPSTPLLDPQPLVSPRLSIVAAVIVMCVGALFFAFDDLVTVDHSGKSAAHQPHGTISGEAGTSTAGKSR